MNNSSLNRGKMKTIRRIFAQMNGARRCRIVNFAPASSFILCEINKLFDCAQADASLSASSLMRRRPSVNPKVLVISGRHTHRHTQKKWRRWLSLHLLADNSSEEFHSSVNGHDGILLNFSSISWFGGP